MEGHILPLSLQMYGCRVVQKVSIFSWLTRMLSLTPSFQGGGVCLTGSASCLREGARYSRPQMCQRCQRKPCKWPSFYTLNIFRLKWRTGHSKINRTRVTWPPWICGIIPWQCLRFVHTSIWVPCSSEVLWAPARRPDASSAGWASQVYHQLDARSVWRECLRTEMTSVYS